MSIGTGFRCANPCGRDGTAALRTEPAYTERA